MSNFTVITENDVSNWDDEKGCKYHFPKRYLKYLNPGNRIIYYKGKIRDKGFENERLSNEPHYFGIGTIGDVWKESNNSSNYFAEIVNYIEFKNAVSFKNSTGNYHEQIPENRKSNYWRDGVRPVDKKFYKLILQLSGISDNKQKNNKEKIRYPVIEEPDAELTEEELLRWYERKNMLVKDSSITSRYSKESKKIGDQGEKIVYQYLNSLKDQIQVNSIIWHANIGETPGYDISYINSNKEKICVEVKSTSAKSFMNFIMTSNEVECARKMGKNYKIFLVADCLSNKPRIKIIDNPTKDKIYTFETLAYKVFKKKKNNT